MWQPDPSSGPAKMESRLRDTHHLWWWEQEFSLDETGENLTHSNDGDNASQG